MRYHVTLENKEYPIDVTPRPSGGFDIAIEGRSIGADVVVIGESLSLRIDGKMMDLTVEGTPPRLGVVASGHRVYLEVESERGRAARAARSRGAQTEEDVLVSPMPGRLLKLLVGLGDSVQVGQSLCVVEAMKMENELKATRSGEVKEILVEAGAAVEAGARLLRIG